MSLQWGSVPDWISAVGSVATLFIAWKALVSWKEQLAGETKHQAAHEIAMAARALRYAFYDARSPLISAWEFPESYSLRGIGESPTASELADEYWHAYRGRLNALWQFIQKCAELRAKAGAVFGDECAADLEAVARKAREYQFVVEEYVQQLRAGPDVVAGWSNQEFVRRIGDTISASPERDDPLSVEFEAALNKLTTQLNLHMK